jgi:Zn-finger nucleic acid-binding protein
MAIKKATIEIYHCERCDHEWQKRGKRPMPLSCPKCKSALWNEKKETLEKIEE